VVTHLPEYLKDFARFGFVTGSRKGSIQTLRWTDVTDEAIRLRAENSKTRKAESVPIEGELADIIERRRAAQVWEDDEGNARFSEYVFHVKALPVGDFRKAWASACKAANVTAHFHDLRRTAARNMIAAGVPQVVARKITGHRTDSMFALCHCE
jgi:integrase